MIKTMKVESDDSSIAIEYCTDEYYRIYRFGELDLILTESEIEELKNMLIEIVQIVNKRDY